MNRCLPTLALLVPLLAPSPGCSSSSAAPITPGPDGGHPVDSGRDAGADAGHSGKPRPDASGVPEASPGAPDAHPDVLDDPQDCVAVTATSSEKGIGGYCSPGAGQCAHAGTGGTATICSADVMAPAHEWFCTLPCTTTSDCGPGGGACLASNFGQLCVPAACVGALGDASSQVYDAAAEGSSVGDATPDQSTPADGSPPRDATAE